MSDLRDDLISSKWFSSTTFIGRIVGLHIFMFFSYFCLVFLLLVNCAVNFFTFFLQSRISLLLEASDTNENVLYVKKFRSCRSRHKKQKSGGPSHNYLSYIIEKLNDLRYFSLFVRNYLYLGNSPKVSKFWVKDNWDCEWNFFIFIRNWRHWALTITLDPTSLPHFSQITQKHPKFHRYCSDSHYFWLQIFLYKKYVQLIFNEAKFKLILKYPMTYWILLPITPNDRPKLKAHKVMLQYFCSTGMENFCLIL